MPQIVDECGFPSARFAGHKDQRNTGVKELLSSSVVFGDFDSGEGVDGLDYSLDNGHAVSGVAVEVTGRLRCEAKNSLYRIKE